MLGLIDGQLRKQKLKCIKQLEYLSLNNQTMSTLTLFDFTIDVVHCMLSA